VKAAIELADGLVLRLDPPAAATGDGAGVYPTSRLRRGLLLADGALDLAEEGVGFGVPVLKYGPRAVFAGGLRADVRDEGTLCTVRAVYRMDLVERLAGDGGARVAPRPLYVAKDALAALHRRVPAARGVLTATSSALRRRFRWETVYVPGGPKAEVLVTSVVDRRTGSVRVEVDLSGLPAGVTEFAVMNEQGARAFDRYEDASGAVLRGDGIGTWDVVTAESARFVCATHGVAFSMGRVDGAVLRRGRELVGDRLAWAGFGLTVPRGRRRLSYELRVRRTA
jgi:hypothetical protein